MFVGRSRHIYKTMILIKKKVHIYKSKVKVATVVESNPKGPFSLATTPRCREGRDSFPWIPPLKL